MIKERKGLNELTVEDYRKALGEIQGHLTACVGNLMMFAGYLASDLALDSDNTSCVLSSAEDVVRSASESVKKALDCTYPLL